MYELDFCMQPLSRFYRKLVGKSVKSHFNFSKRKLTNFNK